MDSDRVHRPDASSPLPRREPRSFAVHAGVDAAVAFLLSFFLLLMWDVDIITIAIAAAIVGLLAAPFTRRAEERALATRPEIETLRPDDRRSPTDRGNGTHDELD